MFLLVGRKRLTGAAKSGNRRIMILGLTGSIASGKSTVAEIFRDLGAAVVSADQLAREAVRPGTETLARLAGCFGPQILQADGTLNRKALADIVFADPGAREKLNRITHPAVAVLAEQRLGELARRGERLIVYEAPLLFEAGADKRVDAVLVVRIEEGLQLERLRARDGLGEGAARVRVCAQMSQEEKLARADYVIDNSGSLEETAAQVRELFKRLTESRPDSPPVH
ncbi:MAG: dephospho-CoA kinase [Desulfuromonadales bacterium]